MSFIRDLKLIIKPSNVFSSEGTERAREVSFSFR
jgi:hypothetical protein